MISNKLMEAFLFLVVLISGFYAGTGFFWIMGGNPALRLMSSQTFAEYWQHTDHYMAARMKIFGPLLFLSLLATVILFIKEYRTPSFWFMLLALCILVADLTVALSVNHPLNNLIQSWDLKNLPANVQEVKWKVAKAFDKRSIFMISAFVSVLVSVWLRKAR